jgi:4-amino-4-deoxy-L-arabinose transferase-like glycosyltransferase
MRNWPIAVAITVLALLVRVLYFTGAEVDDPLRGDVLEYWNYASNLVGHGVFSMLPPGAAVPPPDAYRSPGYPAFLALCLRLASTPAQAVQWAQWLQLLLGAALAPMTIVLARRWLSPPAALMSGLAVALWPHLVVFSSTLLSETLFCFLLLSCLLALAAAHARASTGWAAAAGAAGGMAYLVNPLALFLPPLFAALLALRGQRRLAAACLLAFAALAGAWAIRNAGVGPGADSGSRAATNFVQGSWPLYHAAANDRDRNEIAAAYAAQIDEEAKAMQVNPRAGLATMAERFGAEPGAYLRWYALEKPWLLWDWNVRIGWGDIYFLQTLRSPFERNAGLRAIHAVFHFLNPAFFALAVAATLFALAALLRRRGATEAPLALAATALLFAYVTAVHVVFQAEPRYSVAYRPFEVLLAVSALASLAARWRARGGGDATRGAAA